MTETPRPARWTEYMPLSALTPNPANPKAHDGALIDASVGRFGYIEPLVLDERTGYLISGHGRRETLLAMETRGESAPEGVAVDPDGEDGPEWLVPVSRGWASRTDTEALAALVALNRTTEAGGWEEVALLDLLDQVTAAGGDDALSGVGYDEDAIEGLRQYLNGMGEIEGFLNPAEPVLDHASGTATSPSGAPGSGSTPDDLEGVEGAREADESLSVAPDARVLHVQVPADRYEEAYAALSEAPWVMDVRDAKVGM